MASIRHLMFALALTACSVASAQMQISTSAPSRAPVTEDSRSGLFANLTYGNYLIQNHQTNLDGSAATGAAAILPQSEHAGMDGLVLGYKSLKTSAAGFELSLLFGNVMNSQSLSVNKVTQGVANLNYSFGSLVHLFGGVNMTTVGLNSDLVPPRSLLPNFGGQVGFGVHQSGLQFSIGYNFARYSTNIAATSTQAGLNVDSEMGGLITQVGYIF